ncbi:MAG: heparinase II/III-family protein [Opitutaceae bacterium]|jgi:hypothetical protein|nr:heparinase II/III-family protein [Opitutaceae bacterium]
MTSRKNPEKLFKSGLSLALLSALISTAAPLPEIPAERIDRIACLLSPAPVHFTPPFADREYWDKARQLPAARDVLVRVKSLEGSEPPSLKREFFDEYKRIGTRANYERDFNERMVRLETLVFAEGIEWEKRHLAQILAELAGILDEPSWIVPAHARGRDTWEENYKNVDLAATARAWSLATIDWLLADRLPPDLRARLRKETAARVFAPCLERARARIRDRRGFWWMIGDNNWNAVCNAGVLGSALLLLDDPRERAEFIALFETYIPFYLSGFGDDGYCVESIGYWNYGFGHYILGSEIIRLSTGGQLDLLAASPKVRRIAEFGLRWEIAGGVYPAFGDVAVDRKPFSWMIDFSAIRFGIGNPVGAAAFQAPHPLGPHIYRDLFDVSIPRPPSVRDTATPRGNEALLSLRDWFPDGGALITRRAPANEGLAVAMKGGHNGQPHNHNDLGSFVVVKDGALMLTDPGSDAYVRTGGDMRTRYQSGVNNSFGHPVPRVAGQLQRTGKDAQAITVRTEFTDTHDLWEQDLTSAYQVPELERLTRTFIFTRANGGRLEIIDHAKFTTPQTVGNAIVLDLAPAARQTCAPEGKNALRVHRGRQSLLVSINAIADGVDVSPSVNEEPVFGIIPDRPPRATRIGFDLPSPATEATLRLVITP